MLKVVKKSRPRSVSGSKLAMWVRAVAAMSLVLMARGDGLRGANRTRPVERRARDFWKTGRWEFGDVAHKGAVLKGN